MRTIFAILLLALGGVAQGQPLSSFRTTNALRGADFIPLVSAATGTNTNYKIAYSNLTSVLLTNIAAGTNIVLSTNGTTLTINSSASGGGSSGIATNLIAGTNVVLVTNSSIISINATAGSPDTNTYATRAYVNAQDTVVSNGVTTAFGAADTVVSNGVTTAFGAADTVVSNALAASIALKTNVVLLAQDASVTIGGGLTNDIYFYTLAATAGGTNSLVILPGNQAYVVTNGNDRTIGFTNKAFVVAYTNGVTESYDTLAEAATNANNTKATIYVRAGEFPGADLTTLHDFTVEGRGWQNTLFSSDITLGTNVTLRHLGTTNAATLIVSTAQDAQLQHVWWNSSRGSDSGVTDHGYLAGALVSSGSGIAGQRLHIYNCIFQAAGTVISLNHANISVYATALYVGWNSTTVENDDGTDTAATLLVLDGAKFYIKPYNALYPRGGFGAYFFTPNTTNTSANVTGLQTMEAYNNAIFSHTIAEGGEFYYRTTNSITFGGSILAYTPFITGSGGSINFEAQSVWQPTGASGATNNYILSDTIDAGTNITIVTNTGIVRSRVISQKRPEPLAFVAGPVTNDVVAATNLSATFSFPYAVTLAYATVNVRESPATTGLILDVNTNGVSIFSNTNKLTVSVGSMANTNSSFNSTTIPADTRITVDVDQAPGSGSGRAPTAVLWYYPQ